MDTQLNLCQARALALLSGPDNVFLTGVAGTGKSFLTRHFLSTRKIENFPVIASTGAAAILVGGQTFHSFFGIGMARGHEAGVVRRAAEREDVAERLNRITGFLLDEVSMISGRLLDIAEAVCRKARHSRAPWGGLKVVAVGDFRQLPPVPEDGQEGRPRDWAFNSDAWANASFHPAMLKTPMRATDEGFLKVLNLVRAGICNGEVKDALDRRVLPRAEHDRFEGTRLFGTKRLVEDYNEQRLDELPGEVFAIETRYSGDLSDIEKLKKNAPLPAVLRLKQGALVMVRKNYLANGVVNGTLGYVERVSKDGLTLRLLTSGQFVQLPKDDFSVLDDFGRVTATATNFPVTLAWAATIHKSQGCTLDRALLDLGTSYKPLWEPGQAYVALSRVKSPEGLFISNWTPLSIKADQAVTDFHKKTFK